MASDKYVLRSECPAGLYDSVKNICIQSESYCFCTNGVLKPADCNIVMSFMANLDAIIERTMVNYDKEKALIRENDKE
ncbi:MAG: hypothetical protein ABIH72_04925 [archaeon]